jgi:hypothetical protein
VTGAPSHPSSSEDLPHSEDASQVQRGALEQVESLLRSASLLLAKGPHLPAVQLLHAEIQRILQPRKLEIPGRPYASRADAENLHRKLLDWSRQRRVASRFDFFPLRRRLPEWLSWVTVLVVTGGLTLRYAYALASRANWKRQHPEGNWISRYYPRSNFAGSPLVRFDVGVDYDWGKGAPAQAMDRDHWSARWDTCVVVTSDVNLTLQLTADDSAQLIIDDALLLNVPKPGHTSTEVTLRQGIRHLRVDFQEQQGSAKVRLEGLNLDGTNSYTFDRPTLNGDTVRCD